MEIHSKKFNSDVLYFAEPSHGRSLQGLGVPGVSKMLAEITEGDYGHDYLNVDAVVGFYRNIESRMLPGDEVWIDLVENRVRNIRFENDGVLEVFQNLFIYYES
ncbi:hypothetical protein [Rhizobium laguerreae]|uniref:hypothetical protein n=1 Tax=Rhizobium laguerreae TaxID=1076926 RepID=UPI001C90D68A|nr:hypothetical protein [Rhizobium laguerreae]MBY3220949.1 hypothetical protein [Rhizobium laguerreae]